MPDHLETTGEPGILKKNTLGVPGIVFLVMAAVAPVTVLVVVLPLAMGLGNGAGIVGAFVIMTILYILHVTGYARMTEVIISAGGFYAFVVKGLGRIAGLVTGFVATLGYNFFVIGNIAASGFFFQTVVQHFTGFYMPWYGWGMIVLWLSALSAYIGIDFSAEVLGVGLTLEILTLIAFDVGVFLHTGFAVEAFSVHAIFNTGSLAIGLLMAGLAFLGFEATALFGEEAKDPHRTVPRATFTAVILIGILFTITAWALVSAVGAAQAQPIALKHLDAGDLSFIQAATYVGGWLSDIMQVLVLVSLTAAMLAFHNSATRYWFSLGRARVLPHVLARTNHRGSPWVAIVVQAGVSTIIAAICVIAGLNPLGTMMPVFIGFATLCLVALQMLAALSFVAWFRRAHDRRWWSTFIAPGIAFLGLLWVTVMVIVNFDVVSGSSSPVISSIRWLLLIAAAAGVVFGYYLMRRKPEIYAGLTKDIERF